MKVIRRPQKVWLYPQLFLCPRLPHGKPVITDRVSNPTNDY